MNLQGTLKVATLRGETVEDLEFELSKWLRKNHVDIVKIHFNALSGETDFIQHSAIILYYT